MNKKMKLLIGYDGSESADASLVELARAGLAKNVEALILIDDVWLPSSPYEYSRAVSTRRILASEMSSFVPALRTVEEGRALSRQAMSRARLLFPNWDVRVEVSPNSGLPASELVRKAFSWKADLIVIGSDVRPRSEGFNGVGASLKVVAEAPCSVRLARPKSRGSDGPARLILAVDGSPLAMSAVRAIAARDWPEGSECRFVTTDEAIGAILRSGVHQAEATPLVGTDEEDYSESLGSLLSRGASTLRSGGMKISAVTAEGGLHGALIDEAREWDADCIFIGTHEHASKIGESGPSDSVRLAALLASGSPCSVEISRAAKRVTEHGFLPLTRAATNSSRVGVG